MNLAAAASGEGEGVGEGELRVGASHALSHNSMWFQMSHPYAEVMSFRPQRRLRALAQRDDLRRCFRYSAAHVRGARVVP
jgi:hypothetical protein